MECFKPPPPPRALDASNLSDALCRWRRPFELFLDASGQSSESISESMRVAILVHCDGEAAVDVYNTFMLSEATDSKKLDSVC